MPIMRPTMSFGTWTTISVLYEGGAGSCWPSNLPNRTLRETMSISYADETGCRQGYMLHLLEFNQLPAVRYLFWCAGERQFTRCGAWLGLLGDFDMCTASIKQEKKRKKNEKRDPR